MSSSPQESATISPNMSAAAQILEKDDFRRRRRRVAKQVLTDLREALKVDEISDQAIDQAIEALKSVQSFDDTKSNGAKKMLTHKRSVSDPNMPLTIWMRLRHSAKPARAYRVQTPHALSSVTPLGAIDASLMLPNVARGVSDNKLRQLVMDHINGSHTGSPFISIFTDEQHAEQWALNWSERNGGEICNFITLDVSKITRLFSVKELVALLGLKTDIQASESDSWEDEYLVVHQIPSEAIIKKRKMRSHLGYLGTAAEDSGAETWSSNVLRRSITVRHANGLAVQPADIEEGNGPVREDSPRDDEAFIERLVSSYQLDRVLET
ncbi:hypothetical protein HII31_00393 [Pseudocercospora fuligena]|uniref:DUF7587 domain-containing protein n=1 Tax=Pseudocercospora fuligena TaxID=685502 RepID=A0A8H6RWC3_9PEZI|nr:hypothetical protein HII31_00393 [Pseudocercospora fuligena]